ncbi:MAG: hypothetical protein KTR29_20925 [Rhodothermaceae bacterium]|nr:hypothetical protein [Rhodothermaceae bacterium]
MKFSEIAANTGGQAAMVEDRLGRMSQLDFESITLSSGVQCTAKKSELDRRTETAHKLLLQSGGKQQW